MAVSPSLLATYRFYQVWKNFSSMYFLGRPIEIAVVNLPDRDEAPNYSRFCLVIYPPQLTFEEFLSTFAGMFGFNFTFQLPDIFNTDGNLLDMVRPEFFHIPLSFNHSDEDWYAPARRRRTTNATAQEELDEAEDIFTDVYAGRFRK